MWLNRLKAAPTVWVALSGGVDSMTLLHWASQLELANLKAIHINHNIQSSSDAWAQFCVDQARKLNVVCTVRSVQLTDTDSLETAARMARYEVFETLLSKGDILLQGHHANDQAETLLFRMLRSSSWRSLRAIPETRTVGEGSLYRPWLKTAREQIEQYAADHRIDYVTDPSNQDDSIDRNYLRHRVLRPLIRRWPHVIERFSMLASDAQTHLSAQSDLAAFWLDANVQSDRFGDWMSFKDLASLVPESRAVVIAHWLQRNGGQALPSLQPLYSDPASLSSSKWIAKLDSLELYADQSRLRLETPVIRRAVDAPVMFKGQQLACLGELAVERFHPLGRAHSQRVKKLLLEWQIPARYRYKVPVLRSSDQIVFIDQHWAEGIELDECDSCPIWPNG